MQAPLQAKNDSDAAQTDTARTVAQKRVLADDRPEAVVQRNLAEMMNNSPRVLQQLALSDSIHNSPRMVAQRHQMNALFSGAVNSQGDGAMPTEASLAQREEKTNKTGLPNKLKSGIESLSGMSMDHVKVHYNSDKPAQLQAHAYAQGNEIYLASGQEHHLPHEAWHVVQQAQGRVRPTSIMENGCTLNADPHLENEADVLGRKSLETGGTDEFAGKNSAVRFGNVAGAGVVQAVTEIRYQAGEIDVDGKKVVVGREMNAKLDVNNPVVGTATGTQWLWTRGLRNKYRSAGVVRGHLLNHDLGGSGVPANLFPISTKANSEHSSKAEQKVKKLLNQAATEYEERQTQSQASRIPDKDGNVTMSTPVAPAEPEIVEYRVSVLGEPSDAVFDCRFRKGSAAFESAQIASKLDQDKERYSANAGLIPGEDKVEPHPSWKHHSPHKLDQKWVENLRKNQQGALSVDVHMGASFDTAWPEETTDPQLDYKTIFEGWLMRYANYVSTLGVRTSEGLYTLEQDPTRNFLLSDSGFIEDLTNYSVTPPVDDVVIEVWLKDALTAASKAVPAHKLPIKYRVNGSQYNNQRFN